MFCQAFASLDNSTHIRWECFCCCHSVFTYLSVASSYLPVSFRCFGYELSWNTMAHVPINWNVSCYALGSLVVYSYYHRSATLHACSMNIITSTIGWSSGIDKCAKYFRYRVHQRDMVAKMISRYFTFTWPNMCAQCLSVSRQACGYGPEKLSSAGGCLLNDYKVKTCGTGRRMSSSS